MRNMIKIIKNNVKSKFNKLMNKYNFIIVDQFQDLDILVI